MKFSLLALLASVAPVAGSAQTSKPTPHPASISMQETVTPVELLQMVRSHYESLNQFSMTIRHQDTSGLYPGSFTQKLAWKRGGPFTLSVVSPGNQKVPNFRATGQQVISTYPDGRKLTAGLQIDPNTSPGWEVTGGLILSFLQHTPLSEFFLHPPKGMEIAWSYGSRTNWKGMKVKELVATVAGGGHSEPVHFFINEAGKQLIGFEWKGNGKLGYAIYSDQQEKP